MLYANGIGPRWRSSNMERVRAALNRVDLITLRDETSRKTLASFGVTRPEIHVTADAAYSLTAVDGAEAKKRLEDLGLGKGEKYFGVAVRSWKYNKAGFELEVARFADYIRRRYHYAALFIPMRPVEDTEISRRIMSLMQEPALFWGEKYTTEQITGVVGGAEFMLGMRLHTLIYAARRGTPAIGLVYDGKIKVAMEAMGQPFYRLVEDFTWEELQTFADEILADKENISGRVAASGQEAREKANQNIKLCLALLDKPLF
jgi:polysaccharide pyruvyl transferase WcaK-like protein